MTKPTRRGAASADPSRHTQPRRKSTARSKNTGPTEAQRQALPRRHGKRNAVPHRPNEGQPPGHVGHR